MQKCGQAAYIPSSTSDLFHSNYLTETNRPVNMTNKLLFNTEQFTPFDPNTCNIGNKYFNNFTRYQVRALGTTTKRAGEQAK